jgi:hypothetical protein
MGDERLQKIIRELSVEPGDLELRVRSYQELIRAGESNDQAVFFAADAGDEAASSLSGHTGFFGSAVKSIGDLETLCTLRTLRSLSLSGASLRDRDLRPLSSLSFLESLGLPDSVGDAGLDHVLGLERLRRISGDGLTPQGIGRLQGLRALESLWLGAEEGAGAYAMTQAVLTLAPLRELRIPVLDDSLAPRLVASHPGLRSLSVGETSLSEEGLAALTGLRELEKLQLDLNQSTLSVDGFRSLGSLTRLRDCSLSISGKDVTEAGLVELLPVAHSIKARADWNYWKDMLPMVAPMMICLGEGVRVSASFCSWLDAQAGHRVFCCGRPDSSPQDVEFAPPPEWVIPELPAGEELEEPPPPLVEAVAEVPEAEPRLASSTSPLPSVITAGLRAKARRIPWTSKAIRDLVMETLHPVLEPHGFKAGAGMFRRKNKQRWHQTGFAFRKRGDTFHPMGFYLRVAFPEVEKLAYEAVLEAGLWRGKLSARDETIRGPRGLEHQLPKDYTLESPSDLVDFCERFETFLYQHALPWFERLPDVAAAYRHLTELSTEERREQIASHSPALQWAAIRQLCKGDGAAFLEEGPIAHSRGLLETMRDPSGAERDLVWLEAYAARLSKAPVTYA